MFFDKLSALTERNEVWDIFREGLKNIGQFGTQRRGILNDTAEEFLCFTLGHFQKWQINSEHITKTQNSYWFLYKYLFFQKNF